MATSSDNLRVINFCRQLRTSKPESPKKSTNVLRNQETPSPINNKSQLHIHREHFEALENWLLLFTEVLKDEQGDIKVYINREASPLEFFNLLCQCKLSFWESLYLPGTHIITENTLQEYCPFKDPQDTVKRLIYIGQTFGLWSLVNPETMLSSDIIGDLLHPVLAPFKGIQLKPGFLQECQQFIDRLIS